MARDILVLALKRGPRAKHRPQVHKFKEALHLLEMKIRSKAEPLPLYNHEDVLGKGYASDKENRPCLEQGL
jgi:hypothetical protein